MATLLEIALLVFISWFLVSHEEHGSVIDRLTGKRQRLILDSCALIDGRIVEIAASGFLSGELIIPQFILNELQLLADGSDSHKRERARFGLDIAHQLQDSGPLKVVVDSSAFPETNAVDDKLVALAKKLRARLYTTDYNLGKVAAVEGVRVLNVNELAQQLRPITLPGEVVSVKVMQKGSGREQGVGYLEDGTMIVVENGASLVGRTTPVVVTRMHQTVAGKMVFGQAKIERAAAAQETKQNSSEHQRTTSRRAVANAAAQTPEAPRNKLHHRLRRAEG
ncbi:MAG TPA: hypothetical protein VIM53_01780 [Candidatus Saccharimonadales bacterium]